MAKDLQTNNTSFFLKYSRIPLIRTKEIKNQQGVFEALVSSS